MNDRLPVGLCVAVLILANLVLWRVLFLAGQALHFYLFG